MFGVLVYDILFFAIPALLVLFWGISLYRYRSGKKENASRPGALSPEELRSRKLLFILASVLAGVFLAIVGGFMALLFMAVAFM